MDPVKFPEQNSTLGKGQTEFRPLPAFIQTIKPGEAGEHQQFACKYHLTDLELAQIIKTKCFYFSQYGQFFHPILPQIESPFQVCSIQYKITLAGLYRAWVPMADGNTLEFLSETAITLINDILEKVTNLTAENLYFVEKPALAVLPGGDIENLD